MSICGGTTELVLVNQFRGVETGQPLKTMSWISVNGPQKRTMIYCQVQEKVVDQQSELLLALEVLTVWWKRKRMAFIQAVACTWQAKDVALGVQH